jgi:hypothetical protein
MDWSDETWVKLYRRDTSDWLLLSLGARGLFCLLLRAVSRSGILELGKTGPRAVAVYLRGEWREVEPLLAELLADGCVEIHGTSLVIRNFVAAQEAALSEKARARVHREKMRDSKRGEPEDATVTKRDEAITKGDDRITKRDETVTGGHAASRGVTGRHEEKEETEETRRNRSTPDGVLPPQPPGGGAPAVEPDPPKRKAAKVDAAPAAPGTPAAAIARAIASTPLAGLVLRPNALAAAALDAFPAVDLPAEVARAGGWCVSNPKRAPRADGDRFLWSWLQRAQDRAANTAAAQSQRAGGTGGAPAPEADPWVTAAAKKGVVL